MENKSFLTAEEVAEELCVSVPHAYKNIRELNAELRSLGYRAVSGRVIRLKRML